MKKRTENHNKDTQEVERKNKTTDSEKYIQ